MNAERGQYLKANIPASKGGTPIYALGRDLEALKVGLGDKSTVLYQCRYQTTRFRVYRQDRLCLVDGGP